MKSVFVIFLFILFPLRLLSQDTIFFKNGQVIPAIIVEKNNTEFKYKKSGLPESTAIYSVFVSDISSIHYKDGIIADYTQAGVAGTGEDEARAVDLAGTIKVMKLSFGAGADYFSRNESDALLRFWQDRLADPNATIGGNPLSIPFFGKFGAQFNRVAFGAELMVMVTPDDAIYSSEKNGTYELSLGNFYYNISFYLGRTLNHKRNLLLIVEPGLDIGSMRGEIKLNNTPWKVSASTGMGYHIAGGFDWLMSKRFTAHLRGGYRAMTMDVFVENSSSSTGYSQFYVDKDVSDELLTVSWDGPYASLGLTWSFYFRMKTAE
jgi:hypothetical protein